VTSAAWPHMRANSYGRVVSTASGAGIFGNFGQANYGAAKMGLVGFTRVLAQEGAKYNINANAIAPVAKTRMTEDILGGIGDRLEARYVSPLVTYLCHESCEATGRIFSVAGGRVAEVFIAEGPGYTDPELTPESIAANWDAVTDRATYDVPTSMNEEIGVYLKHLS
jgi:NAD(P)-dependent dehydrogenase (short-subunit alcohol dehydrogenase family)